MNEVYYDNDDIEVGRVDAILILEQRCCPNQSSKNEPEEKSEKWFLYVMDLNKAHHFAK